MFKESIWTLAKDNLNFIPNYHITHVKFYIRQACQEQPVYFDTTPEYQYLKFNWQK